MEERPAYGERGRDRGYRSTSDSMLGLRGVRNVQEADRKRSKSALREGQGPGKHPGGRPGGGGTVVRLTG